MLLAADICNVRAMKEEVTCRDVLEKAMQSRSFLKIEVLAKSLETWPNHLSLLPSLGGTDIAHTCAEDDGCQISGAV